MHVCRLALLCALFTTSLSNAAGLASNENFIVLTPARSNRETSQQYAKQLLRNAEEFRSRFAKEWFGGELEDGAGRVIVSVSFSNNENSGVTWAKDHPNRKFHNVYLKTSPKNALGCTLQHELAHSILATRFPHPDRLPPWVEEGIASRYDDPALIAVREQEILTWLRLGNAPQLIEVLNTQNIQSFDGESYAVAESLVSYLLTCSDKQTFISFAESGHRFGWDYALATHYDIPGVARLQSRWQEWIAKTYGQ